METINLQIHKSICFICRVKLKGSTTVAHHNINYHRVFRKRNIHIRTQTDDKTICIASPIYYVVVYYIMSIIKLFTRENIMR